MGATQDGRYQRWRVGKDERQWKDKLVYGGEVIEGGETVGEEVDGSKLEKVKKQEGSPNLTRRTEWTSSRCQSRRTKQQLSSTGWSHEHKVRVGTVWCALQNFATNLNELINSDAQFVLKSRSAKGKDDPVAL